ncbi:YtpR family tRNA-binding protein [Pediococcus claussenii]|uniref:tRNA binding domain protein n=1 Tax=Pediococcus claussenii (strain ATCC BAA-344 / DSM 14800 / JCM 18046 / KCTC 3811 / LMG 21948 / P06) TaxID=701521 RepID=G8PDS4_PEDCP|nr:DUF4479 and tRNA-binding domain-containing protein [Pediococcus claussenii]AEV95409.1 putative tRNA binding domain protein [Pediococcus claussenii ATCC BAA-344]ANZ68939.1 tRNA-binding protein [Pediococcus claussenii]ANZ70755.1 tRNA-binding protein [Pediococcus claussenii]KRN19052.1 hypothetical protein IV79_GL001714 [Pediococcus claussenii]
MLISSYNPQAWGDILVTILGPDADEQQVEVKDNIAQITDTNSGKVIGINFLNISKVMKIDEIGQVQLNDSQIETLNDLLNKAGFETLLTVDRDPKFVVGYVKSTTPHPDSDHLLITETEIGNGETLQLVSGSPNMKADIKVVVAKVGAMMPNGTIIWPGELRGVKSDGMIVSGRELGLKNAPQKKGALILPENDDHFKLGDAFDFERGNHLFD